MTDLLGAYRHATHNRETIERSQACGCFYCMHVFAPHEITAWAGLDISRIDDPLASADTAVCPRCGSESVIGDRSGYAVTPAFLSQMHEAWFERTIVHRPSTRK